MSAHGSVHSRASRASRVSRGSKQSYVDDSLFGSKGKKPAAPKGAAVLSMNEMRRIRQETEAGKQVNGIILSQQELERIRKSTKVMTKEQEQ
jgi:hypothetical protein